MNRPTLIRIASVYSLIKRSQELTADAILVAAGRKPNIEGLGLEAAGVKFTTRGIPTDARMKTNISHIYACGDVNGRMPFTHVAGYEAGIALSNAILRLPRKAAPVTCPNKFSAGKNLACLQIPDGSGMGKSCPFACPRQIDQIIGRINVAPWLN